MCPPYDTTAKSATSVHGSAVRRPSADIWAGKLTASNNDQITMGRLLGRLFVASTTALICFISYTPQVFIIWPWYGRELSIELLALLVPFKYDPAIPFASCCSTHEPFESILVGILLYNYYLCITTNPGVVPQNWVRHALTQRHSLLMRVHLGTRI